MKTIATHLVPFDTSSLWAALEKIQNIGRDYDCLDTVVNVSIEGV
jgi:hypothetical protein